MRYLNDRHKACDFAWTKDNENETKLERIQLPQNTYDNLIAKLKQNGKALRGDMFYPQIASRIEKSAQTSREGVSVPLRYVETAYDAIESNIPRKGMKYDTNFDRLVLMDLDDAFEAHQAAKAEAPVLHADGSPALDPDKTGFESEAERDAFAATASLIASLDPFDFEK